MKSSANSTDYNPTTEEIRRYAYRLFEEGGQLPGRELDDWLEAERILRFRAKLAMPPPPARGQDRDRLTRRGSLNSGPIETDLDSDAVAKQIEKFSQPGPRSPTSL